jgi:Protein of unknown function (DUF3147)
MKKIGFNPEALREFKFNEVALRFLFGGLSTVFAALVAERFGPVIGGLFLAFPAIFPAGATLIVTREKERLAKIGADGAIRGRLAASIDAQGAMIGCVGLMAFALILWKYLPQQNAALVVLAAGAAWFLVSWLIWAIPYRRIKRTFKIA